MTSGEKMVWAAAFAQAIADKVPAVMAAAMAAKACHELREIVLVDGVTLSDGFNVDGDELKRFVDKIVCDDQGYSEWNAVIDEAKFGWSDDSDG